MPTVKDIINDRGCSTVPVRGLSLQIIAEMNLLVPNVLVTLEDLNLEATSLAVNLFAQSAAKDALRRAIQARGGTKLKLNSVYRTIVQQHLLRSWFEMRSCDIGAAALPGRSNHEDGLAIDTPDFNAWKAALENEGWDWFGSPDEVHFTYIRGGVRDDIGNIGIKAFQRLWNKHNPADQITVDGVWGPQTAARLNKSPADGFGVTRILKLTDPIMQGDDVRRVQQALVNAGFLDANQVDGFYGLTTETAVKNFQESKGLSKDGAVGLQTRRALGLP